MSPTTPCLLADSARTVTGTFSAANRRILPVLAVVLTALARPAAAQVGGVMASDPSAGAGDRTLAANAGRTRNTLQATAGATYSDNVSRVPTNEESDTLATVGLRGDLAHNGVRLDYDLVTDLAWVDYLQGTYKAQPSGNLDGHVDFAFIPERFYWDLRDSYSQVQIDPALAVTPDNVESFNYITTGPRLELSLSTRTQLSLFATYSDVSYSSRSQTTTVIDFDNHRYAGGLVLKRSISAGSNAYLGVNTQRVEFESGAPVDPYTRQEAYLGYHLQVKRTSVDVSGGATRVTTNGQSTTGFLTRIELARQISPSMNVALNAAQQVGDSSDMFRSGFDRVTPGSTPVQVAGSNLFRERVIGARWNYLRGRTSAGLSVSDTKDHYEMQSALERTLQQASGFVARRMTPVIDLRVSATYAHDDFEFVPIDNKQLDLTTALDWQAGSQVGLSFRFTRSRRTSTGGLSDYTENRLGVQVSYDFMRR